MGDNEELSVDQETVDQKVDQPEIGDEPQQQNSTDDFDPKTSTHVCRQEQMESFAFRD